MGYKRETNARAQEPRAKVTTLNLPVEETMKSNSDATMSHRLHVQQVPLASAYEVERSIDHGVATRSFNKHLSKRLMLGSEPLHPGCVPRTKLDMWSSGRQSRCPTGQIIEYIFW